MNNLQIFPYVAIEGGWSLSDSVMTAIFLQLEQEGKIEHLFYDGSVRDVIGWLEFIKRPGNFIVVVADMEAQRPIHIAWLNNVADGVAWAHHASLGKYKRGVWELIRDYWAETGVIRLLLGLTPVTNEKAVKFLQKICKFEVVGEIPDICNLAYEAMRVPGVVSYFKLKDEK